MSDLGPLAGTLLIIIPLLVLGLFLLLLAEGPKEFLASFSRGLAAVRSRWRTYLLDLVGFFSLIAFTLGLMVTFIAAGAVVYYLVRGPYAQLQDYRLYLPLAWTVFWLCLFLACNSLSENLLARADHKQKN
ncbi:MAG: hypothetical protein NT056_07995 [Proteobacteria bacterium]|nr:hypothetical protein [Pseudomonadota bacterium]